MFREMRRKRQMLPEQESIEILNNATSGVLALLGDDGYPYAVPLSFVYDRGRIWFHGAKSGHKLDAMTRNSKASFCVIDRDQVTPEAYTTHYRSVIVFGKMRILEDAQEKRTAIEKLAAKFGSDGDAAGRAAAIDREWEALCMMELTIERMSGKEAAELARKRRGK